MTINAQVYISTTPNNVFTALAGADVDLFPVLTGVEPSGTVSSAVATGLNIPVAAGTLVLVVFSITSAGTTLANSVTGIASAGLTID